MNAPQLPARFANRQTERRQIAGALVAGLGSAAPPYISIKGGSFTLVDANGEQEPVPTKYLDCVIFDVNQDVAIQRVFWGKDRPFDPNSDAYQPPLCFSDNGIGASRNAQEPQSVNCQTCQWNVWGSAVSKVSGKGIKACGALKKVAVIVPGYEIPFLLRVPIMSHENLRVYADKFRGQKFDANDVITRISFVHGQVGALAFDATGFTDDETDALVQKLMAANAGDGLVGRGDVPIAALPEPAPAIPTPAQQPQQAALGPASQELQHAALGPTFSQQTPAKRGRPKAEQPASPAPPFGAQDDGGIPPFLRREPPPGQPAHGLVQNPPAPDAELAKALDNVFGLKT